MLYTNGFDPSTGQRFGSLNSVVSHITSYITWGNLTGWLSGQGPVVSKEPFAGYATWDLWSGLSVFFPSQHLK
jgi:hypothetical protein